MDFLKELKRENSVVANNLRGILPPPSDGIPVYQEAEFVKASQEGLIEVYEVEKVSQFARNLEKAIDDANGNEDLLGQIEKAQKDLSKLVKVKKQDKNGKMTTVYVRAGEKAKEGAGAEKKSDSTESGDGGETKIGKISRSHAETDPDDAIHTYSKEIAHHSGMAHEEYNKLHPGSKKSLLKTLLTHPEHNKKGEETVSEKGDEQKNKKIGGNSKHHHEVHKKHIDSLKERMNSEDPEESKMARGEAERYAKHHEKNNNPKRAASFKSLLGKSEEGSKSEPHHSMSEEELDKFDSKTLHKYADTLKKKYDVAVRDNEKGRISDDELNNIEENYSRVRGVAYNKEDEEKSSKK